MFADMARVREHARALVRNVRRLVLHTSGNATLLVAMGLPAFIGGAGLAVDTAQWYLWKRELQLAVDRAALAGAWARTQSESRANYSIRANQEFNANIGIIRSMLAGPPVISLRSYSGGAPTIVST